MKFFVASCIAYLLNMLLCVGGMLGWYPFAGVYSALCISLFVAQVALGIVGIISLFLEMR